MDYHALFRFEIVALVAKDHPLAGRDYLAHEGYPGHHTEHALRENRQYRAHGQGEYAIQLINTPESLISEAIATCARGLIFDGATDLEWTAAHILSALDMTMVLYEGKAIAFGPREEVFARVRNATGKPAGRK